jgi:hypothetical protein
VGYVTVGMQALLEAGAKPDLVSASDGYTLTPLYFASKSSSAEFLTLLMNAGADPNQLLPDGKPLWDQILVDGPLDARPHLESLLKHGWDINQGRSSIGTALHAAAVLNKLPEVKWLLEHDADWRIPDSGGAVLPNIFEHMTKTSSMLMSTIEAQYINRYLEEHGVIWPFPTSFDIQRAMYGGKTMHELTADQSRSDEEVIKERQCMYDDFLKKIKTGEIDYNKITKDR